MSAQRHGWEHFLEPGEKLLWQGAPAAGYHFRRGRAELYSLLGTGVIFFMCYYMISEARSAMELAERSKDLSSDAFAVAAFELVVSWFLVAVSLIVFVVLLVTRPLSLMKTRYALSDRRAFIATRLFIKTMRIHDLSSVSPVHFGGTTPETIWFDKVQHSEKDTKYPFKYGFEFFEDSELIASHLRRMGYRL